MDILEAIANAIKVLRQQNKRLLDFEAKIDWQNKAFLDDHKFNSYFYTQSDEYWKIHYDLERN